MSKCEDCYNMKCVFVDNLIPGFDADNCKEFKPMANADRIRVMSDEELADWLCQTQYREGDFCPPKHGWQYCIISDGCSVCWLDWLKSPVNEEGE